MTTLSASITAVMRNGQVAGRWLLTRGQIDRGARRLLMDASESLQLPARAYHRVLCVARTTAALASSEPLLHVHVAEAPRYRPR